MYNRQAGTPSDEELAEAKKAYEIRMGIISVQELGDQASLTNQHLAEVREAREKRIREKADATEPGAPLSDAAILEIDTRLCRVEDLIGELENLRSRVHTLELYVKGQRRQALNKLTELSEEIDQESPTGKQENPGFVES